MVAVLRAMKIRVLVALVAAQAAMDYPLQLIDIMARMAHMATRTADQHLEGIAAVVPAELVTVVQVPVPIRLAATQELMVMYNSRGHSYNKYTDKF
jgi:hypothetical protein